MITKSPCPARSHCLLTTTRKEDTPTTYSYIESIKRALVDTLFLKWAPYCRARWVIASSSSGRTFSSCRRCGTISFSKAFKARTSESCAQAIEVNCHVFFIHSTLWVLTQQFTSIAKPFRDHRSALVLSYTTSGDHEDDL